MKNSISHQAIIVAAMALTCIAGEPNFDLSWYTIDGGGATRSTGGNFVLSGTIGQPDAGAMAGGAFKLNGGFWYEVEPGDCDGNGIIDLADHSAFTACLTGPADDVSGQCTCFDANGDFLVDLADFAISQRRLFSN